ncbi:hypothetical protein QE152_g36487, partial [Popillia japonica]
MHTDIICGLQLSKVCNYNPHNKPQARKRMMLLSTMECEMIWRIDWVENFEPQIFIKISNIT